ncbi:tripartite tricarboxylate transporter substrate binding protein [Orrella sp. JC864]|uniref:Bug family tripartite tricarboxylate transporter substrate binding protein n=1 Tax=Orrella sp. JC864 TaxID=3120298 RepID=UPI0030095021
MQHATSLALPAPSRTLCLSGLRRWAGLLAGAAALAAAPLASHAAYPEKAVQVIISFPPAGATDVLARAVGAALSKELGQPIVVENRPGAGGAIGLAAAAKAPADGYTMYLAAITNQAIAASVYAKQPASLIEDFEPVGGVGAVPHALVVPAGLPVKDLAGLVEYLKQAPGKHNFASQGTGTLSHLESELFLLKTGTQALHIPYKGSSQALPELVNGSAAMMFDSIPGSMPLVQGGKLRYLAVASSRRVSLLPDVPTVAESGVPGFEADNWFGFSAPKGTPQAAIDIFSAALQKVLAQPELQQQLGKQGAELRYLPPAELDALIRQEHETWAGVVKSANVQVQ